MFARGGKTIGIKPGHVSSLSGKARIPHALAFLILVDGLFYSLLE